MGSLTLEHAYYIAEIIGLLIVAISLIYLIIQVQQGTKQIQVHSYQEAIHAYIREFTQLTSNESLAKNIRTGFNDFNSLTRDEKAVFHSKMSLQFSGFGQVHVLHQNNLISESEFTSMEETFLWLMLCPGTQQWWEQFRHIPPEYLTSYVDKRMQEERSNIKPANEDVDWFKCD